MPKKVKTRYQGVYVSEVPKRDGRNGTEKAFYAKFSVDGKQKFELAGYASIHNMTAAKAAQYRADRMSGKLQSKKELRSEVDNVEPTIETIWLSYQKELSKSLPTDLCNFKNHLHPVHEKKVSHIDRQTVSRLLNDKLSAQTNAHILRLLNRIINYGVEHEMCKPLSFNIKLPRVNNTKTETLTKEQLDHLFKCLDEDHCWVTVGVIKMALYTGMRKSEILGLKWSDIDFEQGFIYLRDPKGKVDQNLPMNNLVRRLLESLPKTKYEYVFYGRNGGRRHDIAKGISRLRKKQAFPEGFRPLHGLRHHFASMLASSGKVDMYTLQKLLTHKSFEMTQRYAHLHDDALKRGSSVVDDIFKGD